MQDRVPMNLAGAVAVLRRFWYVPLVAALAGGMLGYSTSAKSGEVVTSSNIVLASDRSVDFIASTWDGTIHVGPTATELVTLLNSSEVSTQLAAAVADTTITITATSPTQERGGTESLTLRLVAPSEATARTAADAYVSMIRQLRVDDAQNVAARTTASLEATRQTLQAYIDGSITQVPADSNVVIVDGGDAAAQLTQVSLLENAAAQLAEFDGGVSSSTSVVGTTGWIMPAILLAIVFALAAIVVVLLLSPLDTRIRSRRDIERHPTARLVAATPSADPTLWQLVSAIRSMQQPKVFLIPAGASALSDVERRVHDGLANAGATEVAVELVSSDAKGLATLAASAYPVIVVVRSGVDRLPQLTAILHTLEVAGHSPISVALIGISKLDRRQVFD